MKKTLESIGKFKLSAIGGTFDILHRGHRELLNFAFSFSDKVLVGLTSDLYIKNTNKDRLVESFKKRREELIDFLKKEGLEKRAIVEEINDMFGPLLKKDFPIEALVLSENLMEAGDMVNKNRSNRGLDEVEILSYPMVYGEDGKIISSSRIKNGQIDREGKVYIKKTWLQKSLKLPERLRTKLQKPVGKLIKEGKINFKEFDLSRLITVGDETTKYFIKNGYYPQISLVDFYVERKKKYQSLMELGFIGKETVLRADNPAGFITPSLIESIIRAFGEINSDLMGVNRGKNLIIEVNGEEDLSVLPLLLCAPLGYLIFYGQPGIGIVMVEVTEKTKEWAYNLVSKFSL